MGQSWMEFSPDFNIVEVVVEVALLYWVASLSLKFFVTYVLTRVFPLSADLKKAGSWAVITGCTDGIGKAFAEQLAAQGLNVVLISRTLSKLEDLATEIENQYKVKTLVIAANFIKDDIYDGIKLRMAHLDIGVLINNVGMANDFPEYFADMEGPNFVQRMINTNIMSVAKMTEVVLPEMTKKAKGYIVNVASFTGTRYFPFISLYSSTKSFVLHFTECMNLEYWEKGITFQCLNPLFISTKMIRTSTSSLLIPSPTVYVKSALKTIGLQNCTTGHWSHELQKLVVSIVPTVVLKKRGLQARKMGREQVAAGVPRDQVSFLEKRK